jgi:cytoskeletal protein CcmA (bactofilin family)
MLKKLFFLVLILSISTVTMAAEYRAGETVTIRDDDSLSTDLFAGCRYVKIEGVVEGDIYVGCEQATVEGEVLDDVHAGCRQLTITGKVHDMVIGFAETILIEGEVDGDVLAFGGMLRIAEGAKIKGNVFTGTGELRMEGGSIGGNLSGGAGDVYLNGFVKGEVDLEAGDIAFGESYEAKGGTQLKLPKDISAYDLKYVPDDLKVKVKHRELFFEEFLFYWYALSLLIVGFLIIILFKNFSQDYLSYIRQKIGQSLGFGFLTLIIMPIVIVILAVLILTIPISLILLACFLVMLYIGIAFTALFTGDFVLSKFKREEGAGSLYLSLIIGIIIVVLLPEMPFVGWLVSLLIICFGLGSQVLYLWHLKNQPSAGQRENS